MPPTGKKMKFKTRLAAHYLKSAGVISCPTDTIQSLSCLPNFDCALRQILHLKHRLDSKGLILLASDRRFFVDFVEDVNLLNKVKIGSTPTTYLLKANQNVNQLLIGAFDTIALRLTNHYFISQLCKATNSALVSTSANISGGQCAQTMLDLKIAFNAELDLMITPKIYNNQASKIINGQTGEILR